MQNFHIPSNDSTPPIALSHIVRVEALSNYSKIYLTNGKYIIVSKVLQWVENRLPKKMFARVHRSHLINKEHIQKINGHPYHTLVLSNGDKIIMSRRKKDILLC